jgi:hypothetical protein
MDKKQLSLVLFLLALGACRKDTPNESLPPPAKESLSLKQVRQWYKPDTAFSVNWSEATFVPNQQGGYWMIGIPGRPLFQQQKLGYRRLSFYRDSTGSIQERILEIIPDQLYLQRRQRVSSADFTGRIFLYNRSRQLLGGHIYQDGKPTGTIKLQPTTSGDLHTASAPPIVNESWVVYGYTDSEGNAVIVAERTYTFSSGGNGTGSSFGGGGDPGPPGAAPMGGGTANPVTAPAPSNLPGENNPGINPKDLMKCFSNVPDQGATMKVTVYVQEPFPGTTFNLGPNSVGHTAIGLSKTNGSQSVTQVVGFYPNATGLSKMHAPSKIVMNNNLDYNVSITYNVTAEHFNQIANYIANPPTTYDLTEFNCTNFVYSACKTGNITLPDPYNTIGTGGPGDISTVMAPAGLGSSIEAMKGQSNVNTSGGTTPNSKGACQ